jgi:hypothetical protein
MAFGGARDWHSALHSFMEPVRLVERKGRFSIYHFSSIIFHLRAATVVYDPILCLPLDLQFQRLVTQQKIRE